MYYNLTHIHYIVLQSSLHFQTIYLHSHIAMAPKRKALPIERFKPDDDRIENSKKWKKWKREIENLMDYFEITDSAENYFANRKYICHTKE